MLGALGHGAFLQEVCSVISGEPLGVPVRTSLSHVLI